MSLNGANGWTGGQYSIARFVLGVYLAWFLAALLPWGSELFSSAGMIPDAGASPLVLPWNPLGWIDAPAFVAVFLAIGIAAACLLATGWHDRPAAVALWFVLSSLVARNPLVTNPGLPFLGWLLLFHAALPAAPYGSVAARGRVDPGGGWHFPAPLFAVVWIVVAVGYTYSGLTKLPSPSWRDGTALLEVAANPLARDWIIRDVVLAVPEILVRLATWAALALEILFAPLALWKPARKWLWLAMTLMHLGLLLLVDFASLTAGMLVVHLFILDPAWIRPRRAEGTEVLFYDGTCGLCHRAVRFLLAEGPEDSDLRFAPLQGSTFEERVPAGARTGLPDSIVLATADGRILTRSAAVVHLLRRLCGLWRIVAAVTSIVPAPLRDRAYDLVASVRYRLFRRPTEACPILPPSLRERFDD